MNNLVEEIWQNDENLFYLRIFFVILTLLNYNSHIFLSINLSVKSKNFID